MWRAECADWSALGGLGVALEGVKDNRFSSLGVTKVNDAN